MLAVLDRHIRVWHMWLAVASAVAWFVVMTLATQAALPGVKLFRCPVGLCPGYYLPNELHATLTRDRQEWPRFLRRNPAAPRHGTAHAAADRLRRRLHLVHPARRSLRRSPDAGFRQALLCVPILYCIADYAENWALVEALQRLPQHSLLARAPGKLPDGDQVPAGHGVHRHRHCAGRLRLGTRTVAVIPAKRDAQRESRGGLPREKRRLRAQAPFSSSANTLRAARKHSTPSGTPA